MTSLRSDLPAIVAGLGAPWQRPVVLPGHTNQVVRVGEVVVRWPSRPEDGHRYEKEAWCAARARELGIATPEPLGFGTSDGLAWCAHRWVPGEPVDGSPETWRQIGALAARIATVQADDSAPDSLFTRFGRDLDAAWRAHVRYNLDALDDDPLVALGVYPQSMTGLVRSTIEPLLETPAVLGLGHGDLRPGNIVARPEGDGELVVLDWECAELGQQPWRDLLAAFDHDRASGGEAGAGAAFIAGWQQLSGSAIDPDELVAQEVLARLDLVRWAIDRCPSRLDEIAATARARLAALL